MPTTPPEVLAATLVLDSPAFINTTHVLFDSRTDKPIERQRRYLSREEIEIAKEQLRRASGF